MLTLLELQDQHGEKSEAAKPDVTSTPSKKLGLFWDRSSEAAKLEEELMTTKLHETAAVAELKEARLKVGQGSTRTKAVLCENYTILNLLEVTN